MMLAKMTPARCYKKGYKKGYYQKFARKSNQSKTNFPNFTLCTMVMQFVFVSNLMRFIDQAARTE
jgi:hypothetical protein